MSINSLVESWNLWLECIIAYSHLKRRNRKKLDLILHFEASNEDMKGMSKHYEYSDVCRLLLFHVSSNVGGVLDSRIDFYTSSR